MAQTHILLAQVDMEEVEVAAQGIIKEEVQERAVVVLHTFKMAERYSQQ